MTAKPPAAPLATLALRSVTAAWMSLVPALPLSAQWRPEGAAVVQESPTSNTHLYARALGTFQSFVALSHDIAGVSVRLYNPFGYEGNIPLCLHDRLPTVLCGEGYLAHNLYLPPVLGAGESGWLDVFWDPVAVTPGQTLYFGTSSLNWRFAADDRDPYAGGMAYQQELSGSALPGALEGHDLAFRIWSTKPAAMHVAPEPATWLLLCTGLLGLAAAGRRRRRA